MRPTIFECDPLPCVRVRYYLIWMNIFDNVICNFDKFSIYYWFFICNIKKKVMREIINLIKPITKNESKK